MVVFIYEGPFLPVFFQIVEEKMGELEEEINR